MKIFFIVISCLLIIQPGWAQNPLDSILANERSIDRPLIVHAGQLRLSGGYGFKVNSKRYDDDREVVDLIDEGLTNIGHAISLRFDYGITEYLQFSAFLDHLKEGQRGQTVFLVGSGAQDPLSVSELTEVKGWNDLSLLFNFKWPFITDKYDIVVKVGGRLATTQHEPEQPNHTWADGADNDQIIYQFTNHRGNGSSTYLIGTQFKWRTEKMAFSGDFNFVKNGKETQGRQWFHQLVDDEFEYRSENYTFLLGEEIDYSFQIEWQALPFLDVLMRYHSIMQKAGWSEATQNRTIIPEISLNSWVTELEVIITHRLWLRQSMVIPLSGLNSFAPFQLNTSVIYNFSPF